jgi:hypothetical protein
MLALLSTLGAPWARLAAPPSHPPPSAPAQTCFSAMQRQDRQATARPEHGNGGLQATALRPTPEACLSKHSSKRSLRPASSIASPLAQPALVSRAPRKARSGCGKRHRCSFIHTRGCGDWLAVAALYGPRYFLASHDAWASSHLHPNRTQKIRHAIVHESGPRYWCRRSGVRRRGTPTKVGGHLHELQRYGEIT